MALKRFKPVTPSNRFKVLPAFEEITKSDPERKLVEKLSKSGGRNNQGRITCRHIGGGHKGKDRLVDFKRKRREEAAKDPLIEFAADWNEREARAPGHGTELFDWMTPLFSQESEAERRVRLAACLMADIGWRRHPEDRDRHDPRREAGPGGLLPERHPRPLR